MKVRAIAGAVVLLLLAVGCVNQSPSGPNSNFTWDQVRRIRLDMSESWIQEVMGPPTHIDFQPEGDAWTWRNTDIDGSYREVTILIKDHHVVEVPQTPKNAESLPDFHSSIVIRKQSPEVPTAPVVTVPVTPTPGVASPPADVAVTIPSAAPATQRARSPGYSGYAPSNAPSGGGDVYVKSYVRKDGTYVQSHYRSAPGSGIGRSHSGGHR